MPISDDAPVVEEDEVHCRTLVAILFVSQLDHARNLVGTQLGGANGTNEAVLLPSRKTYKMKEVEIKGHAIRTTHLMIRDLFGASIATAVDAGMSEEFRSSLRSGLVVSSGWYPIAWYRQFHDILKQLLPGEATFARRLGRATTEKDSSGMYRFILRLTSAELIARHFDKIISCYFRGGQIEVAVQKGAFTAEARGWYGMTHSMWEEAAGGCEFMFESTGAKAVASQVREVAPGSARAEFSWK